MSWTLEFSRDADKFLKKQQHIKDDLISEIKKFIRKLEGERVSLNIKKLTGDWEGFYRIKKGKIRIIFLIEAADKNIYIEKIDFRGSVY